MLFTIEKREEIRNAIISNVKSDNRIVSAAVIGSYSRGEVDRWSDIDLTFGIDETVPTNTVMDSMTEYMIQEFQAVVLFDISRGTTMYRVFILPGCLQVDLSFSSVSHFGAVGSHFTLLYGSSLEKPQPMPQKTRELFGYMIHHLLRAKFCAERDRLWQAEFWLAEARNYALKLACISHNLTIDYGRGYDDLPQEVLDCFTGSFIAQITKEEIVRGIREVIAGIPMISDEVREYADELGDILTEITSME
ncbi:MAG: nucleotidyltransferase domain-containing protein [Ignavibacteria bacterium]|nr:nucleotidyltransferase domain-containing protein [Ignavibacteria bacterium]